MILPSFLYLSFIQSVWVQINASKGRIGDLPHLQQRRTGQIRKRNFSMKEAAK